MGNTILGANTLSSGFEVANSCMFNDDDSAYMHITRGSAGNQRTFTISMWIHPNSLGGDAGLISKMADGGPVQYDVITAGASIRYGTGDQFLFGGQLEVGNWYHLTLAINFKDNATIDKNSFKFYKNGIELTTDNNDNELMSVTTGTITLDNISRTNSNVSTNITINAYNRRYVIGNIYAFYFDIFIWNRLLTSGIQNIMYYGKSIKNNSSGTSPDLTFPYNGLICEEFVKTGPIGKYNKDTTLQDVYGSDLIPNNLSLYDDLQGVNYLIPFVIGDRSTILFDNNNIL